MAKIELTMEQIERIQNAARYIGEVAGVYAYLGDDCYADDWMDDYACPNFCCICCGCDCDYYYEEDDDDED